MTSVTEAFILAGGQGRRMGYQDKGLVEYQGLPLIKHVIDAITPQVQQLNIIANRNIDTYKNFDCPVYKDKQRGFLGPLAGIQTAFNHCQADLLLIVPCDTPLLPSNLYQQLEQQLINNNANLAIACDELKTHPVIMLVKTTLATSLNSYLASDQRKVMKWCEQEHCCKVMFNSHYFTNFNTIESTIDS
ncbi:molybdenum cofactor guanylyltransferase [Parashewanella spongiae]|uniref:Molybdenum cofactor guanylyltransferase n=1 Tax=Parashewanella spongiae TaxID=342950 RepID=A0A3A6THM2_9GAMM|nr:molybdenum cofactor guanylyltransferase MobA [Parashewanella spongiae]MCL1079598.1 molybdenum cofactor guanylyltransferase [Parashewanella spongiae]RJY07341.1 molybdenum cofactor guanylyltransferase [Parashewanella spongiae]